MYDTLKPELLTATEEQRRIMTLDPTAVVSKQIFYQNAFPYLELRRPFILGVASDVPQWKATLGHYFMRVMEDKGLLKKVFQQNIDGLDFQTGVSRDKIVTVHGTLGIAQCEFCDGESAPRLQPSVDVCASLSLFVYQTVCLSPLSLSLSLSVCLSVCLSLFLFLLYIYLLSLWHGEFGRLLTSCVSSGLSDEGLLCSSAEEHP